MLPCGMIGRNDVEQMFLQPSFVCAKGPVSCSDMKRLLIPLPVLYNDTKNYVILMSTSILGSEFTIQFPLPTFLQPT